MLHRPFARALILAAALAASGAAVQASDASTEGLFKRLTALAPTGNAEVAYNLGMFLNNGIGTARDTKAAFRYFQQAAEGGNVLAAFKVGCYHAGQFEGAVPVDPELALKHKLVAAEAGYDLAQQDVGTHYRKRGDTARSLAWFERAARQGDLPSMAWLAHHHAAEASPDQVKGLALMLLLKERSPQAPTQLLERIAAVQAALTPEQLAEAGRQKAAWVDEPTSLTLKARSGMKQVPELLALLEKK